MPATTAIAPTGDTKVDGLLWLEKWAVPHLTFGFPALPSQFTGYSFGDEPYNSFAQLDSVQQALVRTIFGWIATFTNLTFTELLAGQSGQSDLRFGMSDAAATAYAYLPDPDPRGGDSWFNHSGGRFNAPVAGTYGYVAFIHEIGHALGLKHPHDTDDTGIATPTAFDSVEYSVMSYHSYVGSDLNGYTNGIYSYPQTPMMLDIAALQHLYGANFAATAGNDSYRWDPDSGQFTINGVSQPTPGFNRVFQTIWDGGGEDVYDFSLYTNSLAVDLRPGEWTTTSAAQLANLGNGHFARGNIANALLYQGDTRSLIENAIGGSADDTIIGNIANNKLWGGGGNDILDGGDGSDMLDGGTGSDAMTGGRGNDIYYVDDPGDSVTELAGEGSDEIRTALASYSLAALGNVENLTAASDASHDLRGNSGDNVVTGAGGADFIFVQDGGNDNAIGGGGNDVIYFGAALTSLDKADGGPGTDQIALQGNYGGGVTFGGEVVSIESLALLPGSDTRFGDNSGSFYDYVITTVDANVAAGVQLVIDANRLRVGEDFAFDGSAESDGNFFIYGGGGTDNLIGGARNDVFYFGEGGQFGATDIANGGSAGTDQLGLRGNYTIAFGAGQLISIESIGMVSAQDTRFGPLGASYSYDLTMNDGNVSAGRQMTVDAAPLRAAETLRFDGSGERDGSFRVFGGAGNDSITGSDGNDNIKGRGGDDVIAGGLGADQLTGGAGADTFLYQSSAQSAGAGADHILDFEHGDRIDVHLIDANGNAGDGDQAFAFIGAGTFSGVAGELRASFDSGNNVWAVEGDTNGDGVADFLILVAATTPDPIVSSDFVL